MLSRQRTTGVLAALYLGIGLVTVSGAGARAEDVPKEGSFTTTFTIVDVGTKELETVADHEAWSGENYILQTNDSGKGIFQNMSGHCVYAGGSINTSGGFKSNGQCLYSDPDGSTFYTIFEGGKETKDATQRNTVKITAGTGKYAGIQGQYENMITWLKSPIKAASFGIGHTKGSYKIVPVSQ